jgi:DNA-binding NtrC family response regulator
MPSRKRRELRLTDFFRTRSAPMRNVLQTVEKVLDHDVPILVLGESGTGKDYLAQAIHACGGRRNAPFVHIDCATIPPELFESEMFGYEKGTFTDAQTRKLGTLEVARGGTVYFDNISSLLPAVQAKLLRALQDKSFTRLGGGQTVAFDARVISSAGADLVAGGDFRRDLFYRVNVVTVTLPPLRMRREDVPVLAKKFTARRKKIGSDALELLIGHAWPGNVRELRNVIDRAVLTSEGDTIEADDLALSSSDLVTTAAHLRWTLDQLEETYIREVLRETRSNYSRAAEILGINRKTLLEKRRRYGLA